jgi:hypothetical protein
VKMFLFDRVVCSRDEERDPVLDDIAGPRTGGARDFTSDSTRGRNLGDGGF